MEQSAKKNDFANVSESNLKGILRDHRDVFRAKFSSNPGPKLLPLKINLVLNAKPVKVRLRRYS